MFAESLSGSALASGAAPHVVITTYDLIIRDESKMASVKFLRCVSFLFAAGGSVD